MQIAFDLEAPDLAGYRWGSLYTHFSWFATPTKELFHEIVRMLAANTAPWKNAVEFRATLSFLHEFVHYLQDVSTGVGNWDYLVRRQYIPKILGISRFESWIPTDKSCPSQVAMRVASEMREKSLFVPFRYLSPDRIRKTVDRICALMQGVKIVEGEEIDVSTEAMLECEAAWLALEQVLGLGMSDEQSKVLASQNRLLDLHSMGRQYWGLRDSIHHDLLESTGDDSDDSLEKLRISNKVLTLVVDIACAHPSPELLEKKKLDLLDCAPPVRFIQMVNAIHRSTQQDADDYGTAMAAKDYGKLEDVLLRNCKVKYPSSEEVYADWKEYLAAFESKDQSVSLRITSCDRRLEEPMGAGFKTLGSLLLGKVRGLPIYCQTDNGLLSNFFAWRDVPGSETEQQVRGSIFVNDRDMRLAELAANGETFRCPLAKNRACEAAEARCSNGIDRLDLLPLSTKCMVRKVLTDSGWLLQGGGHGENRLD